MTIAVIALPANQAYRCLRWFDRMPQLKTAVSLAVLCSAGLRWSFVTVYFHVKSVSFLEGLIRIGVIELNLIVEQ